MTKAELNAHWAFPDETDETFGDSYTITHKREREAFIKGWHKAVELCCEWLQEYADFYINDYGILDEKRLIQEFKDYMKEQ